MVTLLQAGTLSKSLLYHRWLYPKQYHFFLIEKYNQTKKRSTIWDKVSADIKKGFNSKAVYETTFLKTKIKQFGDQDTDFYNKEILKVDSNYTCLTVIRLDSAVKNDENYYPQVFLKKCKYI